MSSVRFHFEDETLSIGGRERHMWGNWVERMFKLGLNLDYYLRFSSGDTAKDVRRVLSSILPGREFSVERADYFQMDLETALHVGADWVRIARDKSSVELFGVKLNTAIALGSDEIRLVTRLHAASEVHGWLDPTHRTWMADLMQSAVDIGVMRRETQGYEGVERIIEKLRKTDCSGFALSYSVTGGFPLYDEESGEHLSWRDSMALLNEDDGLQLRPSDWASARFFHEYTAHDVRRYIDSELEGVGRGQ